MTARFTVLVLMCLTACSKPGGEPALVPRCEVDLPASGLFAMEGQGASARLMESPSEAIGGSGSTGTTGDVLLQNERIRVVIEKPGRIIGPILSGGGIIDADVVRAAGEPGRDIFGRSGLIHAFGRIASVSQVEVLRDGSKGGPAVVASTGRDAEHDLVDLPSMIANQAGLRLTFAVDARKPLPLRITTYYVLSPGESRVRLLTAFCNDGTSPVSAPLAELMDLGSFELFKPGSCRNGLGQQRLSVSECVVEPARYFATQGSGVAYGLRSMSLTDLARPGAPNAVLGYAGLAGAFVEGRNLSGLLSWTDPAARDRPGAFAIRSGATRSYLRDFFVARDLAGIHAAIEESEGVATGEVQLTARFRSGEPAPFARISVADQRTDVMVTLVETDQLGQGSAKLAPGVYRFTGSLEGHLVGPPADQEVVAGAQGALEVVVAPARALEVQVSDPFGAPLPAKVTVLCARPPCPFSADSYQRHFLLDWPPGGAAAMAYAGAGGRARLTLPPGEYELVVTRGPEFSAWPESWPNRGHRIDLTSGDQSVRAVLGRVVDSAGWMSADLHVHASASSDSAVRNEMRVENFMAEGVDVLLSTDHDVIVDYGPVIRGLRATAFITSMIGEEVTSFTHGHFNAFPLARSEEGPTGGAYDHAGGEGGATPRLPELFSGIKAQHPGAVVQLNHPRGGSGVFSQLRVDTATLATHAPPIDFKMDAAPDATSEDSRLLGDAFDALEVANGPALDFAVANDWMTFLSRGTVRTATGTSDTHGTFGSTGGYARTWARVGVDAPEDFSPSAFAEALRAQRAVLSNGPYLRVTARRLDRNGQPLGPVVEVGDTLSVNPSGGEAVELSVDVQGVPWMRVDRVELYSHAPGREAVDGQANDSWPDGRILDRRVLDPTTLPLEAVPGNHGGLALQRVRLVERFVQRPTADTWYVVMVRGSRAAGTMWPLHSEAPVAVSNAILIDADGSGRYDDFPLKPGRPLRVARPPLPPHKVPTPAELAEAIRRLLEHPHPHPHP